jgi:hypothetical protein
VVLRNGDITDPVLVDLGLSFNDADEDDDLTRAGEEVGNRFLRLPEHPSGGRDAVSGESADQSLTDAITRAVAKKFLFTQPP